MQQPVAVEGEDGPAVEQERTARAVAGGADERLAGGVVDGRDAWSAALEAERLADGLAVAQRGADAGEDVGPARQVFRRPSR
jgi:hypothetical protein